LVLVLNKAARRRLAADVGDLLNRYLVEGDHAVVTAGIRTHRIERP